MSEYVDEIRIYPVNPFDYPTEEYAKVCISNGFENHTGFYNLGNANTYLNLYQKTLFLFQYNGKIIAKGTVHLEHKFLATAFKVTAYYTDEIMILDEPITATDIKNIWTEFKKFNSAAQIIPKQYLPNILRLFGNKKKMELPQLNMNESFALNRAEGNKIEYYVSRYERNPEYREQAIKRHGLICQICGFDFKKKYGCLGEGYIEVHHKKPLYSLDNEIIPNPETDMICVCSNCHRMLHRHRNSIVSPEELIAILYEHREKE